MAKGISTERKLNQLSHTNGRMEISRVFDTVEVVQENPQGLVGTPEENSKGTGLFRERKTR